MSLIHIEDPRIDALRLRVRRASLAFRWLGAAGVTLEDVGYLLRRYDERGDEIELLRKSLIAMTEAP